MSYTSTIAAISGSLLLQHLGTETDNSLSREQIAAEILAQQQRMPDYLRLPIGVATVLFDWSGVLLAGRPFTAQLPEKQLRQLQTWRCSPIGFCRNFVRFYESLFLLIVFPGAFPGDAQ